ncbi:hypothetical protein RR42_m2699 [Cupriavidus basilensis]|uniref:Uncharacterized protein n=1 Tax=Cupriavidus basilensis TaxID=68895 RepID=A0A0C4YDA5_9BURK|nr:hypothetical protein RR42_m2699 [Cupriavidus basilensis]
MCVVDLEGRGHFEKRRHVKRFEFCQVHRRGVQRRPDGLDLKEGEEMSERSGKLLMPS